MSNYLPPASLPEISREEAIAPSMAVQAGAIAWQACCGAVAACRFGRHEPQGQQMPGSTPSLSIDDIADRMTTLCASEILDRFGDAAEVQAVELRASAVEMHDTDSVETWDAVLTRISSLRKVRALAHLDAVDDFVGRRF